MTVETRMFRVHDETWYCVTCDNVWWQTVLQPSTSNSKGSVANSCTQRLTNIQLVCQRWTQTSSGRHVRHTNVAGLKPGRMEPCHSASDRRLSPACTARTQALSTSGSWRVCRWCGPSAASQRWIARQRWVPIVSGCIFSLKCRCNAVMCVSASTSHWCCISRPSHWSQQDKTSLHRTCLVFQTQHLWPGTLLIIPKSHYVIMHYKMLSKSE